MTQFIHKCNRALSRIFQDGKRITRFERLVQSRQRSQTYVDENGELITENEVKI